MILRGHASIFAIVAATFCVSGCERAADIAKDDLIERANHWKEPKVAIWYYTGSKREHDYFRFYDLGVSQLYRVPSGVITLPATFPYTGDRTKWIVMPWGPAAKRAQSSNQTMQRTAGRSAFELSMTAILNLQRRSLSPAVADLGSR